MSICEHFIWIHSEQISHLIFLCFTPMVLLHKKHGTFSFGPRSISLFSAKKTVFDMLKNGRNEDNLFKDDVHLIQLSGNFSLVCWRYVFMSVWLHFMWVFPLQFEQFVCLWFFAIVLLHTLHLCLIACLFLHDRQNWSMVPAFIALNVVTSVSLHIMWALLEQADQLMNLWVMAMVLEQTKHFGLYLGIIR